MAQRTVIQLIDDLTGEELNPGEGETVRIGFDGVMYELDLSTSNAAQLRDDLSRYVQAARRTGTATGRRRTAVGADPRAVRAWAASNGLTVSGHGRIPASVLEQYRAAGH